MALCHESIGRWCWDITKDGIFIESTVQFSDPVPLLAQLQSQLWQVKFDVQ